MQKKTNQLNIEQKPKQVLSPFLLKATDKHIIPIASGKGGVGKTFFSINLGIQLARLGKRPVIIDLDLGGSNLHTYLGMKNSQPGILSFVQSQKGELNKYKVKTGYGSLDIILGDQLIPDAANITNVQKRKIMEGIYKLPNDFVILDLGAGASPAVTDFFLMSGKGLILSNPTHGAVLNAFGFLKTVVYRLFRLRFQDQKSRRIIAKIKKKDEAGNFPTFWDVLNEIASMDRNLAVEFKKTLDVFNPGIVFNMVDSLDDVKLIRQLISLIYNKLILDLDLMGYLPRSPAIHDSVRKRKPIAVTDPEGEAAQLIKKIAIRFCNVHELNKPLFDISQYDSSVDMLEEEIKEYETKEHLIPKLQELKAKKLQSGGGPAPSGDPFGDLRKRADDVFRRFSGNG